MEKNMFFEPLHPCSLAPLHETFVLVLPCRPSSSEPPSIDTAAHSDPTIIFSSGFRYMQLLSLNNIKCASEGATISRAAQKSVLFPSDA